MNKTKIYVLIVILLFFAVLPQAFAKIEEYTTTIDLDYSSSKIRIGLLVSGSETGISTITLPFSFYPKTLIVYSDTRTIEHKILTIEENYLVRITHQIEPNSTEKIYLEFERISSVEEIGGSYLFGFEQKIPKNIKLFEMFIRLPEGAVLANLTDISPVSPEPTSIGSDGRRIILGWVKQNIEQEEDFRVIVAFEKATVVEEEDNSFLIAMIISLGLSFIIIPLLYYFLKKKESKIMTIGLDKEEKRIYDLILLKKETKQKTIQKELDISKARLSKLIRKLEEKGLIEKKPTGRTNLIKIKKVKGI